MKMRVQVVIESAGGEPTDIHEITCIAREELRSDTVGLTLDEAKMVLERLQQAIVAQQTAEYLRPQSRCSHCGNKRFYKGDHTVTIRTVFGKLRLKSPRFITVSASRTPPRPSVLWPSCSPSAARPNCSIWKRSGPP